MTSHVKFFPLALFTLYLSKNLILGASLFDTLNLFILAGLSLLMLKHFHDSRLSDLSDKISVLTQLLNTKAKDVDDMKNYMSGLKLSALGQQFRNPQGK